MVIRTYSDGSPQPVYLRPGVAYDPLLRDNSMVRRFQSLMSLQAIDAAAARRAALSLEHELSNNPTGVGLVQSQLHRRDLESILTHLLNARASLYWTDLRLHPPLQDAARGSSRSVDEVWNADG